MAIPCYKYDVADKDLKLLTTTEGRLELIKKYAKREKLFLCINKNGEISNIDFANDKVVSIYTYSGNGRILTSKFNYEGKALKFLEDTGFWKKFKNQEEETKHMSKNRKRKNKRYKNKQNKAVHDVNPDLFMDTTLKETPIDDTFEFVLPDEDLTKGEFAMKYIEEVSLRIYHFIRGNWIKLKVYLEDRHEVKAAQNKLVKMINDDSDVGISDKIAEFKTSNAYTELKVALDSESVQSQAKALIHTIETEVLKSVFGGVEVDGVRTAIPSDEVEAAFDELRDKLNLTPAVAEEQEMNEEISEA